MGRFAGVELDDLTLTGTRLLLRPWTAGDAERVVTIMRDRAEFAFLALPDPYNHEAATEFVSDTGLGGRADGTGLGCAVAERNSGRVVGSALLRLTGDAEIGYWVAPDARGHGYAAEMTRMLAAWAFERGVPRVGLLCDVRNLASAHTALAAGFRFEGVSRNALISGARPGIPELRGELAGFARLAADSGKPIAPAFPPLPRHGLDDGVLRLRAAEPGDAQGLLETEDEVTTGWSFTGAAMSADDARLTTAQAGIDWLVGRAAQFTMIDMATGRYAGEMRLRQAGPPQVGGVGYVVHPAFRGRGFTTRALRLLAPWAFGYADFARLELGAKTENIASQRAAAAAGFVPDGIRAARLRNADGTFGDEVRFALVNPRHARGRAIAAADDDDGSGQARRINP